jgi:predicted ribosomally synthesized peptide with nif11-like leader
MAKETCTSTENIAKFFEKLRGDSGLQGQLLGELAHTAPELLAKIAGEHGYTFSPEDLKQLMTHRATRSLQGQVFWSQVELANGGGQLFPPNQRPVVGESGTLPEGGPVDSRGHGRFSVRPVP